jgi:hypothetical protein
MASVEEGVPAESIESNSNTKIFVFATVPT